MSSDKHFAEAEACLDQAEQIDSKNRDVAYLRARIKAFQDKHEEAEEIAKAWPAKDRESLELRGDLAWYRGDIDASEQWYRQAADDEAPVETWKNWLKAVKAQKNGSYSAAVEEALSHYPEDAELQSFKSPEKKPKKIKKPKKLNPDRSTYRANLGATYIRETQNQNVHAVDADAAVIAHKKSATIGASSITRDYGPVTFTDQPFRASVGMGFKSTLPSLLQSQEATLTVGGTAQATFTPKTFIAYRHELFFSDTFSLSGEISAKWYPELFVRTSNLSLTYYANHFRYQTRLYNTHARSNDFAGYLGASYRDWVFVPEVYILGGRDAASRPYLFDSDNASFLAAGAQLTYRFNASWATRGVFEERWESGFRQQSFSIVLLWSDR